MTPDNSGPQGFGHLLLSASRTVLNCLPVLAACLVPMPVHADSSEWLNFPMYSRDTAHTVHLKALSRRPDGLLESASRYPGHDEEKWSAQESAMGQHEYERRLIDCQTGLHFTYETRLLARDGSVVASRATSRDRFVAWKAEIESYLRENQALAAWPASNEIFLACAAHADPALLKRRAAEERRRNTEAISHEPLRKTLAEDVTRLWQRVGFRPVAKALANPPPKTTTQVFLELQRQHAQWLKPFAFTPATTVETKAAPPQQGHFQLLAATPEGMVRYLRPYAGHFSYFQIPPPLKDGALEKVAGMDIVHLAHCQLGLSHPEQVIWRDAHGKPLARHTLPPDRLLDQLRYRDASNDEGFKINFNDPSPSGQEEREVCQAAARQCLNELPDQPDATTMLAAVHAADTPEAVLLAVRRTQQAGRDQFMPSCRIGRF
ncbi:MAG: hypothetical protein WAV95_05065 [Azonexus sp.]